ncbi:MAG: hypothetical protein AAFV80_01185 [Bacteroidota bacterium]
MELRRFYETRAQAAQAAAEQLKKQYDRLALGRLLIFLSGIGIGLLLYGVAWWAMVLFILLFLPGFGWFMNYHERLAKARKYQEALQAINEAEVLRIDHKYEVEDTGIQFLEPGHPYALDLDVFGPLSLYGMINRCTTQLGCQQLATDLLSPLETEAIRERQAALTELSAQVDWRQNFQSMGWYTPDNPEHLNKLQQWLEEPSVILGKRSLEWSRWWIPVLTLGVLFLPVDWFPWSAKTLVILLVPGYFYTRVIKPINRQHELTGKAMKVLRYYADLIQHIESGHFEHPHLKSLQKAFRGQVPASTALKRLSRIINQLNVRYNLFSIPLNLFLMWDFHFMHRLDKWRQAQRESVPEWFDALGKFESLISLSTLHFNKKDSWIWPMIDEHGPWLDGQAIGHPLLSDEVRVDNPAHFADGGHLKLVTGSNMAGKSTFLRSVGSNIALAMIGAPVCARSFTLRWQQVCSGMRTQDDLKESTSSFYAELKRLKFIIESVESGRPIFFLLDEILKGTNSHDRHSGTEALIHQLIQYPSAGMIATHDLELGHLESEHPKHIENLCFEVAIQKEEFYFDYKVKKGLPQTLNATLLMAKMGIRMKE